MSGNISRQKTSRIKKKMKNQKKKHFKNTLELDLITSKYRDNSGSLVLVNDVRNHVNFPVSVKQYIYFHHKRISGTDNFSLFFLNLSKIYKRY